MLVESVKFCCNEGTIWNLANKKCVPYYDTMSYCFEYNPSTKTCTTPSSSFNYGYDYTKSTYNTVTCDAG